MVAVSSWRGGREGWKGGRGWRLSKYFPSCFLLLIDFYFVSSYRSGLADCEKKKKKKKKKKKQGEGGRKGRGL